jgi:serine/threonine protein kinase
VGRSEIGALLGAGGMGEVYGAHDATLGRAVAIKILPAAFVDHPDRLHRFELEARAAAALNHPNILAVYDVGQHDGTPYIVSELLEGQSLRARLDGGKLPHGDRVRHPDRRRISGRTRQRHRPSRPEAGERLRHAR